MTHFLAIVVLLLLARSAGADDLRELSWASLVPHETQLPADITSRGFLAKIQPSGPDGSSLPTVPEGPWMSSRMQQPDSNTPAALVRDLDGQHVRIGGYIVSLDFDAAKVNAFLLVPYVGACIHIPPPPPNQIIYVKAAESFGVSGPFEPVYVTGTLRAGRQFTGLAVAGYSLEAAKVKHRKE